MKRFIVALMICCGVAGLAKADSYTSEQVALARICVSEAGWEIGDDCGSILSVLRSRSERMRIPLMQAMRAYSSRTFDRSRTDSRRWIAELSGNGFPRGLAARHQSKWRQLLDHAGELLANPASTCDVHHWGSNHGNDLARALRAGWTRVDCGDTKNAFWNMAREL